jgi:type IV pilus assembly protein PilB
VGFSDDEIGTFTPMISQGCPNCNGTGVKGRQGIYEVLRNTSALEEAILRNDQAPQILEVARQDGFKTLQETGRGLIKSGVISLEEFQRSLNMDS